MTAPGGSPMHAARAVWRTALHTACLLAARAATDPHFPWGGAPEAHHAPFHAPGAVPGAASERTTAHVGE